MVADYAEQDGDGAAGRAIFVVVIAMIAMNRRSSPVGFGMED
jgi:hypothetical protein